MGTGRFDKLFDHVALALADFGNIHPDRICYRPKAPGVLHRMRDLGAPDYVLGGEAVDIRAGAANPPALHQGSTNIPAAQA